MKLKSKPADFHSAYNPALFTFERDNTDSQSLCTMHLYIEEQDITLSKKFGKESQAILDVSGYLRNFFKEYKNDKFDEAYTTDHHHLMFEYAVQQPDTMVTRQSFTTFRGGSSDRSEQRLGQTARQDTHYIRPIDPLSRLSARCDDVLNRTDAMQNR